MAASGRIKSPFSRCLGSAYSAKNKHHNESKWKGSSKTNKDHVGNSRSLFPAKHIGTQLDASRLK